MTVIIKRRTNWIGMALPLTIKLNGIKVGKVKFNEEEEIDLPNDNMKLSVSQTGSRSNKLLVSDGDTVIIKSNVLNQMIFYLFLILVVIALPNFFESLSGIGIILILGGIVIANFFLLDHYKIEISDEAESHMP